MIATPDHIAQLAQPAPPAPVPRPAVKPAPPGATEMRAEPSAKTATITAAPDPAVGAPPHATGLGDVALVSMAAVLLGFVFMRLRQPPMVGYILAGLLLGPTGLGFIAQSEPIRLLAELGVLILLFLIGMELSLRAFVAVIRPAVMIAGGQLAAALAVTALFSSVLGWTLSQTLLLAFVIAVSSTAVAIKILEEIDELRTETGRITIGVLIAQDIAIVPMLIVTEALGGAEVAPATVMFKIALAVGFLVWLVWYLGRPGKMHLPLLDALSGRPDVMTLAALAICFATATASGLMGLSPAYGAFVAGLILANSTLRSELIAVTHPIQSILVFVFFLSIGLLLDIAFIWENFATAAAFVAGVIVIKTVLNITLTRLAGYSLAVAIPAGLSMAQIGEFSFVLAAAGFSNGTIDFAAYRLAIAVIAMSLLVSPLWMITARRFHAVADRRITTFRAALAETYPAELAEIERGAVFLTRMARMANRYMRATLTALRRRAGDGRADPAAPQALITDERMPGDTAGARAQDAPDAVDAPNDAKPDPKPDAKETGPPG